MPVQISGKSPLQYKGAQPVETIPKEGLVSLVERNVPLRSFLEDWEAVRELTSWDKNLRAARFPDIHIGAQEFALSAFPLDTLNLGDGQTIRVEVVPGYLDGSEIRQFDLNGKDLSLSATTLFRPEPTTLDISKIVVNEMKDGTRVTPPTLEQYLKNAGVNPNGHKTLELYSALIFVPVSTGGKDAYKTQLMIRASSYSPQWYKPVLQGKEYGGPIFNSPHTDKPIDMIGADDKGKYWKVVPVDVFGELAPQIFGSDTGRLVIVSFPQFYVPQFDASRYPGPEDYGPQTKGMKFGGISATHISAGGSTGRDYSRGDVQIDVSRGIKALFLLTLGIRPEATREFSLERVLPYLAMGK